MLFLDSEFCSVSSQSLPKEFVQVFGLDNCLRDNVVDHKLWNGRGAPCGYVCKNLVKISYGVSFPSNPKLPVVSGVVPIAVLTLVWPTNGGPIMDPLRVSDGNVPSFLPPQSSCGSLDQGDNVVVPLDGGQGNHLGQFLNVVAGGGVHGGHVYAFASAGNYCVGQVLLLG